MRRTFEGCFACNYRNSRQSRWSNPIFIGVSVLAGIHRLAKSQGWQVQQVVDVGAHFGKWAGAVNNAFPNAEFSPIDSFSWSFGEQPNRYVSNLKPQ